MMFLNKANVRVTLRKDSHVQTDLAWHILCRHILTKASLSWRSNARLMHAPLLVPFRNHVPCLGHMLESPTCPQTQTRTCIRRLCPESHIYRKAWVYRSPAYHVLTRWLSRQNLCVYCSQSVQWVFLLECRPCNDDSPLRGTTLYLISSLVCDADIPKGDFDSLSTLTLRQNSQHTYNTLFQDLLTNVIGKSTTVLHSQRNSQPVLHSLTSL